MDSDWLTERPCGPVRVGVSECLLGSQVRYDGTGAAEDLPHAELSGRLEYQGFCPEVGIGMSVPRPPIHLVGSADDYQVVGVHDPELNQTQALIDFAHARLPQIDALSGYIFMDNSPSCGLYRVKVYAPDSPTSQSKSSERSWRREGTGAYAATIIRERPYLPVEEAGRLFDAAVRDNFLTRVYVYAHWQQVMRLDSESALNDFHATHKFLLMAHSDRACMTAEQWLRSPQDSMSKEPLDYLKLVMSGLQQPATRKGHMFALKEMIASLGGAVTADEALQLAQLERQILAYRDAKLSLETVQAQVHTLATAVSHREILRSSYFAPFPR